MKFPTPVAKIITFLLAVLTPLLLFSVGASSKLVSRSVGEETAQALEKAGGFMTGICHAEPQYEQIKNASIGWIREDLPYPFDDNGNISASYLAQKKELQGYAAQDIKVLAITPNPNKYLEYGVDIRNEADIPEIQRIARFYMEDLKDIVSAFQVTNEMGIERFTQPLTLKEAAKFIGVQLEAMYPMRGDVLVGYNLGGFGILKLPQLMKPYHRYVDFVGVDMYLGCFENVVRRLDSFIVIMDFVHTVTKKPIIMTEFGYIGCGEPKTAAQKKALLEERYGVSSEAEAKRDMDAFISRLPEPLREEFASLYGNKSDSEKADLLFNGEYANHIYCELSDGFGLKGYPHTPEGQAKFYTDLIPMFQARSYCIGTFIYMWRDSASCYVCGQSDCPVETGWGLIDGQGHAKPAYDAVRKVFAH